MTATTRRRRGARAGLALLAGILLAACAGSQPRNVQTVGGAAAPLDSGQPGGTTASSVPPIAFGGNATTGAGTPSVHNPPRRSTTGTPTPRASGSGSSTPANGAAHSPTPGSPTPTSPVPTVPAPAAPPAGGNGGATDVGVTADTITMGNVSDLGGPVPGLFQGGPYGTQAYFNYINSQGG
ncbi:MAG TPA: hypothetical protein VGL92_10930, partial [Acidimicrobiia bacterium]